MYPNVNQALALSEDYNSSEEDLYDISYFQMVTSLLLNEPGAIDLIEKFNLDYPNNYVLRNVYFDLANYYFNNEKYTLERLVKESNTVWDEPEWGYPKGRRNYQEKDLNCALREFEEETGYLRNNLQLIQNVIPFEEIFTGSNYKSYKHRYYIALLNMNEKISNQYQESEVSKVEWKTYDDMCNSIRPYNLEKIDISHRVNKLLSNFSLYS